MKSPHNEDRRNFLTGITLAAGGTALFSRSDLSAAADATSPTADMGPSQAAPLANVEGKVAYITGGSSGIGLGLAHVFYEAGMKVVIGYLDEARGKSAFAQFPERDKRIHAIQHDVMDRDSWSRVADEIEKKFGKLHLLANNAGVGVEAAASTGTYKDWEWGLGVNLWGPIYGVHTFVPRMLAHNEGSHIVTTSSMGALLPGSGAGVYAVSKVAAIGLMEELRVELRNTSIGTSVYIPAGVATNLRSSENYRPETLRNDKDAAIRPPGAPVPPSGPLPPGMMDPIDAARVVLDGIRNNDLFIFSHPEFRPGVQVRCDAILESMDTSNLPFTRGGNFLRTPIYAQEIVHRRARRKKS
jgi:NAD(P)-dependent dehydrogenase (short-subunit alcohol dehydrogenase family)